MGRLTRIVDVGIALAEAAIERISDPDSTRLLRESLDRADRSCAELVEENARLADENQVLQNRVGQLEREFRDVRSQLLNHRNTSFASVTRANALATIEDALAGDDKCYCGLKFRTAEDFRDHLPCDGPAITCDCTMGCRKCGRSR